MGDVRDGFTSTQLPTSLRLQQPRFIAATTEYIVMVEPAAEISLLIAITNNYRRVERQRRAAFDTVLASVLRDAAKTIIADGNTEIQNGNSRERLCHRLI